MALPGNKLGKGKTRLILLEDSDQELRNRKNPAALQEEAAEEQNKTKICLATHGTDSVHYVPLLLVPDISLKDSNFGITKFPYHIVFPLGLLLKQLFTTSLNTLAICSYISILSGLCLPPHTHFVSLTQEKWYKFLSCSKTVREATMTQ